MYVLDEVLYFGGVVFMAGMILVGCCVLNIYLKGILEALITTEISVKNILPP